MSLIIISLSNICITTAIGIANNKPSGLKIIVKISVGHTNYKRSLLGGSKTNKKKLKGQPSLSHLYAIC